MYKKYFNGTNDFVSVGIVAVAFTVATTSVRKVWFVPYMVGYNGDARVSRFQFPNLKTTVKRSLAFTLHTP